MTLPVPVVVSNFGRIRSNVQREKKMKKEKVSCLFSKIENLIIIILFNKQIS